MGSKNYFVISQNNDAVLRDIDDLNKEIDLFMDEPEDDCPNFVGFVKVDNGEILFHQGSAGEDSDDSYDSSFRNFGDEVNMCKALSTYLVSGSLHITLIYEGSSSKSCIITPNNFRCNV